MMTQDDRYEALVRMHRGLDEAQSLLVSSRLVLLLAQHVADDAAFLRCVDTARACVGSNDTAPP